MLTGVIKVNECLWQKKGTAYVNNLGNLCIEALEMLFFAVVVICDFFIYFIVFFLFFFLENQKHYYVGEMFICCSSLSQLCS